MKNNTDAGVDEIVLTDELVEEALELAAHDAIESHRLAGLPLVGWRNGKIAFISAEEVLAEIANRKGGQRRRKTRRRSE